MVLVFGSLLYLFIVRLTDSTYILLFWSTLNALEIAPKGALIRMAGIVDIPISDNSGLQIIENSLVAECSSNQMEYYWTNLSSIGMVPDNSTIY
jgi:hypothetical protein